MIISGTSFKTRLFYFLFHASELHPPPSKKKSEVSNVSGNEKAVNAENKNTQFIKTTKIHINESMT